MISLATMTAMELESPPPKPRSIRRYFWVTRHGTARICRCIDGRWRASLDAVHAEDSHAEPQNALDELIGSGLPAPSETEHLALPHSLGVWHFHR
jgi:hypothetical protein